MPRPRTFDEDQALDAAMRVFWTVGYEATSTEQLCAATGLGRSSLYNTFTSKHELFTVALERYVTQKTAAILDILDGQESAREKIRRLLWRAIDTDPDEPTGCLVVNSMVELASSDEAVSAALRRDEQRRIDALRIAIAAGQREGSIVSRRPAQDLARFVTATMSGLQVAARGGADRSTREAIANTALDAL